MNNILSREFIDIARGALPFSDFYMRCNNIQSVADYQHELGVRNQIYQLREIL